jgi:glycosyltransferase 2 family protein
MPYDLSGSRLAKSGTAQVLAVLRERAWLIKLGLSLCLLWLVIRNTGASLADLSISQPVFILLAAFLFMAQPLLNIPRWSLVLKMLGYAIPMRKLVGYFYIGLLFNQILPASVSGDVVRVFYLSRNYAVPWRHSISSVLLDRLVALGGLVILYVALFNFASSQVVGHADAAALYYAFNVGILVGLIVLAAFYLLAVMSTDAIRRSHFPGAAYLAELLRMLFRSIEVLGGNLWKSILILGGLGIAVHVVEALGLLLVLRAFGYSVDFIDITVIASLIIIVQSLPISLGGWGARELVAVELLQRVGVGASDAFFVSIILGLMFLLGGLPGIVFWLANGAEKPREQAP